MRAHLQMKGRQWLYMDDADPSFRGTVMALTVIVFFCALGISVEVFFK
jgi:hypothetical protein